MATRSPMPENSDQSNPVAIKINKAEITPNITLPFLFVAFIIYCFSVFIETPSFGF